MQSQDQRTLITVALLAAVWAAGSQPATAQANSYSGDAVAVQAKQGGTRTTLVSTGTLTDTGDAREASAVEGSIPGLFSGESLHATAIGSGDRTNAEASVATLTVEVNGNTITAELALGRGTAVCSAGQASALATTDVDALLLNGQPVTVTGEPNQTVSFPGGRLVINEQQISVTGNKATAQITALHISAGGTYLLIGSANAGITCAR